jgi:hypothetical protein
MISLLVALYIPIWRFMIPAFITKSILLRSLLVMATVFPLGFLMGIPFPLGLKILRDRFPEDIPLAYAINGVASVVGSVLILIIALAWGYIQAMILSSVVYLAVMVQLRVAMSSSAGGMKSNRKRE